MNYIGSKQKLSSFITSSILDTVGDTKKLVFAELFGGTGIIARNLKSSFNRIIVNDFEYYSYVLLRNYIGNNKEINYFGIINELNNTKGKEGKIFSDYCVGGGTNRNYFSDENGKRIDAIRKKIESNFSKKKYTEDEYYFALASLLESADSVANTASVYGAYLKKLKKSAEKPLVLEPALFSVNNHHHQVFNTDANGLIKQIEGDVLYLDPPYNHRQYGANYHLLNTIALYDDFVPKGKTGLRDYKRSKYCTKAEAEKEFEELITNAKFKHIFLSYNNEGIIQLDRIKSILKKYGKYELLTYDGYHRFKADRDTNRNYKAKKTIEYLHILEKDL